MRRDAASPLTWKGGTIKVTPFWNKYGSEDAAKHFMEHLNGNPDLSHLECVTQLDQVTSSFIEV